jgi:hypothetical protein
MPKQKLNPNEETIAISIRLPSLMKEAIQELAVKERRSLNQEIVYLLQTALDPRTENQPIARQM